MDAKYLLTLIAYCFNAHSEKATKPSKAVRLWDRKTPYGIHPTWGAMTILTETKLPEELRFMGAEVFLFHDILEDTTAPLPEGTDPKVVKLVEEMTFDSFDDETIRIWERSFEAKLLKLYDKVSNLLDGAWMKAEKRQLYIAYLELLCDEVEPELARRGYIPLNIITIARAIIERSI